MAVVTVLVTSQWSDIQHESIHPSLWIMVALAAFVATRAFVATFPVAGRTPVIICPTILFTFAIFLLWGLGPAILAQILTTTIVALRLRRPVSEWIAAVFQYALAFTAAQVVLWLGPPHPEQHHAPLQIATDTLSTVGAVGAWLLVYGLVAILAARLIRTDVPPVPARDAIGRQMLFVSTLLMLSPFLAMAAHMDVGLVPLIFIPLYAVQRMARLSAQRDLAARMDPLTGLMNRTGLKAAFQAETRSAAGGSTGHVALLLADLDEFKNVNDTLGHEVGDQILVEVGNRLERLRLRGGVIARLGGDEFALMTSAEDSGEAQTLATEAVSALSEPVSLDGLRIEIAASIGIAFHTDAGEDFATLMRHADIAMYDAKQHGGTTAIYEPGSHQDSLARLALLTDFRHALEDNDHEQICMHYQPQVRLDTGDVEGVEALLRWRHPEHGLINTQDLITMVEHSSVMHLLTTRVINDVVAQVSAWNAAGIQLRTSINVSSRDLYGGDIVPRLAERMSQHGVHPSQIQVEITESALMRDPGGATGTVNRIHDLGVTVSLDDFGTGYSSLQHLRKMPISEIKIDRSFVAGMASNHDDAAIVRSTVELANSLGIRTVAEGVENEYTRQLLADAGCGLAQGWLTAYPMPAAQIEEWITTKKTVEPAAGGTSPG
jgi:diguanylate cyclase